MNGATSPRGQSHFRLEGRCVVPTGSSSSDLLILGQCRRCQAENPLIDLSKFAEPPLRVKFSRRRQLCQCRGPWFESPQLHQPPSDFIDVSTVDSLARVTRGCGPNSRKIQSLGGSVYGSQGRTKRPVSGDGSCVSQSRLSTLRQRLRFETGGSGSQQRERRPLRRIVAITTAGSPRSRSAHRRSLCQGYAARGI